MSAEMTPEVTPEVRQARERAAGRVHETALALQVAQLHFEEALVTATDCGVPGVKIAMAMNSAYHAGAAYRRGRP